MHSIKLILTDVDGTILPYGHRQIPARTIEAFHAAIDAGIHLGVATGRDSTWVPRFFGGDAACSATSIASNGSEVFLDGRKIRESHLDVGGLREVAAIVREVPGAGMLVFYEGKPLLVEGTKEDLALSFPAYAAACQEVDDVPDEAPIKGNVFFGPLAAEEYEPLVDRLNRTVSTLDFDIPQPGFGNIMPHGSNKATAIDVLVEALGITLDQVVVFGDNGNDVPMLSHVPNSVAVSNASAEAATAARWHVGACDDEAVGEAIAALAAGEWPFTV